MSYEISPATRSVLRFLEALRTDVRYTVFDGVASNQSKTDNMRAARIGATPPVRAARHSGVDE